MAMAMRWRMPPENWCGIGGEPGLRIGNADAPQHVRGALALLALRTGLAVLDVGHLAADRQHRVQRRHRVLEDHRDAPAAQTPHLLFVELQQVLPVEQDLAAGDLGIAGQQPHDGGDQRGLAAAGLAHDAHGAPARECRPRHCAAP
jgi:hypothetical protein